jgi:hypothetical protein
MKAKALLFRIALAIAAAGFAAGATAAMYKWTDKEGNVHYSQMPPEEGNATEIAPPPPVSPPANDNAGNTNGSAGQGGNEQQVRTKEQEESDALNCKAARANLDIYQSSDRYRNSDGDVVVMDNATRQRKIEQAQEQVKKFCH